MRASVKRALFMSATGLVVAGGLAYAFWPRPIPVDLATIERGAIRVTVDGEGQTRVRDVYSVSSPLPGRIARIRLRPGDRVEAMETLITHIEETDPTFLDARTRAGLEAKVRAAEAARDLARADLERAQAELEFAESELRRAETLFPRGTVTERALSQARLDHRTGKARVATAEATLRMREFDMETARAALIGPAPDRPVDPGTQCCLPIRAPVDGVVLRVLRESAGIVQAGDVLVELGNPADLEIVVDLPSAEAIRLSTGADVSIEAWGGEGALAGRVRRIEPNAFTKISALGIEEQRVNVIIDLLDPPERRPNLGHGFRILARAVVHAADDVLLVPAGALFREGGDWAVFVADGGRARLRRIRVGASDGRIAEVAGGLEPGERVVLYPGDTISDGVRVAPRS